MKRLCLVVLCVMALGAVATAQSQTSECATNCAVSVGQPFIAFTEADPLITSYALLVNGQPSGVAPSVVNGLVEFAHPGFASPASITLTIRATVAGSTFDYTDPFSLSVVRRKIKIRR